MLIAAEEPRCISGVGGNHRHGWIRGRLSAIALHMEMARDGKMQVLPSRRIESPANDARCRDDDRRWPIARAVSVF